MHQMSVHPIKHILKDLNAHIDFNIVVMKDFNTLGQVIQTENQEQNPTTK
jgi:hypothetical protein